MDQIKQIYFAGGCFWGVEEFFSRIPGVVDVTSGYANGETENPTYREVCLHKTGHAETVRVEYDPEVIGLSKLTELFFSIIDPTSVDRQGNDCGPQYRSGVYYADEEDKSVLQEVFRKVKQTVGAPLATELLPLRNFYRAEENHQRYLKKHPGGYCHIDFSKLPRP